MGQQQQRLRIMPLTFLLQPNLHGHPHTRNSQQLKKLWRLLLESATTLMVFWRKPYFLEYLEATNPQVHKPCEILRKSVFLAISHIVLSYCGLVGLWFPKCLFQLYLIFKPQLLVASFKTKHIDTVPWEVSMKLNTPADWLVVVALILLSIHRRKMNASTIWMRWISVQKIVPRSWITFSEQPGLFVTVLSENSPRHTK